MTTLLVFCSLLFASVLASFAFLTIKAVFRLPAVVNLPGTTAMWFAGFTLFGWMFQDQMPPPGIRPLAFADPPIEASTWLSYLGMAGAFYASAWLARRTVDWTFGYFGRRRRHKVG